MVLYNYEMRYLAFHRIFYISMYKVHSSECLPEPFIMKELQVTVDCKYPFFKTREL